MAKLGSYYGLCPLIDHKSLLGVSESNEKGTVIVTLGKNIAVKHKLSDQKQVHSWRTKDKFTSPVIYDAEQQNYVAAFNSTYIRLWTKEDEHLDKMKKLKFSYQIQTIFTCGGKGFILFKSGSVYLIKDAIELRKSLQIEPLVEEGVETVTDILHISLKGNIYVGLIIKSVDNCHLLWTIHNSALKAESYFKITLERDSIDLVGYVFHQQENIVYFLTLWADGKMFANILQPDDSSIKTSGIFYSVIEVINCEQPVSMISLDENYIALYGADCNEEGASLIIYNVQFKVTQSKLALKLFTKSAKLWCIESNLILPVGQHLAVVPYHLDTEQLAALVGSHKAIETENDSDVSIVQEVTIGDWGHQEKNATINLPTEIKSRIPDLCQQGLPENSIIEQLIPDIVKKQDMTMLSLVLNSFCDIPEEILIKFLSIVLNAKVEKFKSKRIYKPKKLPQKYLPLARSHLLDVILSKAFSSVLILPSLRSLLDFDDVLKFIEYIHFMLSDEGHCLGDMDANQTRKRLIDWASVLLDANFQKILLMKDDSVIELLTKFRESVEKKEKSLNEASGIVALLVMYCKGKRISKNTVYNNSMYSIELINLY